MKEKILLYITPTPVINPQWTSLEKHLELANKICKSDKIETRIIIDGNHHSFNFLKQEIYKLNLGAEVIVTPTLLNFNDEVAERILIKELREWDVKILSALDVIVKSLEEGFQLIILEYDRL